MNEQREGWNQSTAQPKRDFAAQTGPGGNTAEREVEQSKQAAREGYEEVKREGREALDDVKAGARSIAADARRAGAEGMREVRDRGSEMIERRKMALADTLDAVCESMNDAAERLREENSADLAEYAEAASRRVDGLACYIRERDVSRFIDDLEEFASRRPEIACGGMALAGLAAARFLKSSRPTRYSRSSRTMTASDQERGASRVQASAFSDTPAADVGAHSRI